MMRLKADVLHTVLCIPPYVLAAMGDGKTSRRLGAVKLCLR
jgi:hypothetical protein